MDECLTEFSHQHPVNTLPHFGQTIVNVCLSTFTRYLECSLFLPSWRVGFPRDRTASKTLLTMEEIMAPMSVVLLTEDHTSLRNSPVNGRVINEHWHSACK